MKKALSAIIVIFVGYSVITGLYRAVKQIAYEFKGRVQKVTYASNDTDEIITVNNKQYDLECLRWYDDSAIVEVGDSVAKEKGTQMMFLQKRTNSHK